MEHIIILSTVVYLCLSEPQCVSGNGKCVQISEPHKNSQAMKKWCGKSLAEKSCEIKGSGQGMAAMMLMLINFNNAYSH